jgi:hypothetical protein
VLPELIKPFFDVVECRIRLDAVEYRYAHPHFLEPLTSFIRSAEFDHPGIRDEKDVREHQLTRNIADLVERARTIMDDRGNTERRRL